MDIAAPNRDISVLSSNKEVLSSSLTRTSMVVTKFLKNRKNMNISLGFKNLNFSKLTQLFNKGYESEQFGKVSS